MLGWLLTNDPPTLKSPGWADGGAWSQNYPKAYTCATVSLGNPQAA